MDLNQLVALDRIVREGTFSRAARALDLSQAAISARVQALEAEVGEPLLLRGGRRVTLTDAGEAFLPHARRALTMLSEGVAAAREARSGQFGRISLYAPTSVIDGFLADGVVRYRATHPKVVLAIRVAHTDEIVTALADGIATLGVVTRALVGGAADLITLATFREPLIAVVAPTHPLAEQTTPLPLPEFIARATPFYPVRWGTLDDARHAWLTGAARTYTTRSLGAGIGGGHGMGTGTGTSTESALPQELVRLLVARGQGGALFPLAFVRDDLRIGRLRQVALDVATPAPTRDLAIVHQAGATLSQAALDFVAAARAQAREFLLP